MFAAVLLYINQVLSKCLLAGNREFFPLYVCCGESLRKNEKKGMICCQKAKTDMLWIREAGLLCLLDFATVVHQMSKKTNKQKSWYKEDL